MKTVAFFVITPLFLKKVEAIVILNPGYLIAVIYWLLDEWFRYIQIEKAEFK